MAKSQNSTNKKQENKQEQTQGRSLAPASQRFLTQVEKQFVSEVGSSVQFTEFEKTLAQHLFLKINETLKELESKRKNDYAPFKWENVNMEKLALDAVHRVNLGLDALIPAHIYPIPYWNKNVKKYDLNLQIGYKGEDYYMRQMAVEKPKDVTYRLVYENDHFKPIWKDVNSEKETYEFEPSENPFDRGQVVGGFGYIEYEDPTKNKLVLVYPRDFAKAENASKGTGFWEEDNWREEMQYKTIVKRTLKHLPLDPKKINKSIEYVQQQELEDLQTKLEAEKEKNANTIDITSSLSPSTKEDKKGEDEEEQKGSKEEIENLSSELFGD